MPLHDSMTTKGAQMPKQPWMKWYPSDWRGDPLVRACSPVSRYVWMEMIGLMHEAEPYGHLILAGRAIDYSTLAALIGMDVGEVKRAVKELESRGVFSRTEKGVIYSRRMVRASELSETRAKNGAKGAQKTNSARAAKTDTYGDLPQQNDRQMERQTGRPQKPEARVKKIPKKDAGEIGQPDGVSDAVWRDFVALRHRKDAPITETAMAGIRREAEKAGWTLESALAECATRGWQGFKAEWVNKTGGSWSSNTPTASTGTDNFIRRMEAFEAKQKEAVKP
jgi:hypothetical protein